MNGRDDMSIREQILLPPSVVVHFAQERTQDVVKISSNRVG